MLTTVSVALPVPVAVTVAVTVEYWGLAGLTIIVVLVAFAASQQARAALSWPQQKMLVLSQGVRATGPEGVSVVFRRVPMWHKGD